MNEGESTEPSYWFRMLFEKVDSIDRKLDGQSETIVNHGTRLDALERDFRDQKDASEQSRKAVAAGRQAILIAAATAIVSGLFAALPLFIK